MKVKSMLLSTVLAGSLSTTGFAQAPQTPQPGTPGSPVPSQGTATQGRAESPVRNNAETTLTGCLEKNKSGGFWLTKAMPAAGGAVGTSGTTAAGSSGATSTVGRAGAAASMVYNLEEIDGKVGQLDLDKHVGHKVEVTGRVDDTKSSDKLKNPSSAAAAGDQEIDAQDFHISAVKMIAATCQ